MVVRMKPLEADQPPTNCSVVLTCLTAMCVEHVSHSVFWATMVHQLVDLLEQAFPSEQAWRKDRLSFNKNKTCFLKKKLNFIV
jgi:hypothetical protein